MEQKKIDIASSEIAIAVDASLNTDYYQAILRALQDVAVEHDFRFVMDESGERTDRAPLSVEVMASMARTVNRLRQMWLSPQMDEEVLYMRLDIEADDGHDHVWLTGLLNALSKKGIVLVPASNGDV